MLSTRTVPLHSLTDPIALLVFLRFFALLLATSMFSLSRRLYSSGPGRRQASPFKVSRDLLFMKQLQATVLIPLTSKAELKTYLLYKVSTKLPWKVLVCVVTSSNMFCSLLFSIARIYNPSAKQGCRVRSCSRRAILPGAPVGTGVNAAPHRIGSCLRVSERDR